MKKVFYDGNCPICNREIELYKKLNKNKSVKWYNIYTDTKALKIINKSREECLKAFHVIDGDKIYSSISHNTEDAETNQMVAMI